MSIGTYFQHSGSVQDHSHLNAAGGLRLGVNSSRGRVLQVMAFALGLLSAYTLIAAPVPPEDMRPADELTAFPAIGPAPATPAFEMEGYWIWDGSVVKGEDGKYHMFASRWPKSLPFHPAWMTSSEVVRAVADRPEGPYVFAEVVLPARGTQYWDGRSTHNPRVVRADGTWLLYYMGSTSPLPSPLPDVVFPPDDPRCIVARNNKRIGLATATAITGPWQRSNEPVLSVQPETFYSYQTGNPSPVVLEDGSIYLCFKGRPHTGEHDFGKMTIGVAQAEYPHGPYRVLTTEPVFSEKHFGVIEDPFVWRTTEGFALIAKDMTGRICGEKYAGIYATSTNGIDWLPGDQPKSWALTVQQADGSDHTFAHVERPHILFEDGKPAWLFVSVGDDTFAKMQNTRIIALPLIPSTSP